MHTQGIIVSPVNMTDRAGLGIKSGDTVRVHQKIQDKGKTRIQIFEGLVLARKHGAEPGATFTVRKMVDGTGVEKIYPLYSPLIDKIEIVRRAKVRRAKLYHIREKVAREAKRQMRRMQLASLATMSDMEEAQKADEKAKKAAAEEVAAEEARKTAEAAEAEKVAADAAAQEAEVVTETPSVDAPETPAEVVEEKKEEVVT